MTRIGGSPTAARPQTAARRGAASRPEDDGGPPPGDGAAPRSVLDLRLVVPAAAAWLAACVVVRLDPTTGRWAAYAATGGAVLLFVLGAAPAAERQGRRRRTPPVACRGPFGARGGAAGASVALALAVVGGVLASGSAQVAARELLAARPSFSSGVPVSPDARAPARAPRADAKAKAAAGTVVTGSVQGIARPLAPSWPGAPARARVDLVVERLDAGNGASASSGTVVLIGPAAWRDVSPGARVTAAGRWSVLPPGDRAAAVLVTDDAPTVVARPPAAQAAAATVRATVTRQAQALPGDARALLPGVTVGDTGAVPDDLREALRVSGLTHLTAVSGAHFALVGALAVACVGAAGAPGAVRAITVLAVGAALVVLVGPSPSVLRAAVMATVGCGGLLLGRRSASPAALAAAVVVLVVLDPWLATELGFVLSVLATAGLVLLGRPLAERWASRLPRPVADGLAAPVAAQVACAPAVLLVTPTVSVLGVVANLLAAPAVAPATVLGLAAAVVGTAWPAAGAVLALPAGAACWWIGAVARGVAATPGAAMTWIPGVAGVVLLAVAGAAAARVCWPSGASP